MNRVELISAMAEKSGVDIKDTEKVLKAFMDVTKEEVAKGNRVTLVGFGAFDCYKRKATTAFGKKVPAKVVPRFTAGKAFKDAVLKTKIKAKRTRKTAKKATTKK